jgi:predicted glycoside hydrolase/deacetylase ChbG (UPF0249 family)
MKKALASACLAAAILGASWGAAAQEKTYAERLGFPEGAKVVIFHSDDAGMSYAANQGTIKSMEEGVVTSCSIMMPCPWVPGFVKYAKEKNIDAGLHLTMNSEWDDYRWAPVAGAQAVPSLADDHGYLPDGVRQVAQATPDDVEEEIRAQIDKAVAMGLQPTHIDSHMGALFSRPEFIERYYAIGIEKKIPVLAIGGHLTHAAQSENPEVIARARAMAEKVWEGGLPVLDDLHTESYDWKTGSKTERFAEALRNLKPGVTQFIVHCSSPNEVFPSITPSAPLRYEDTNAMVDPALKKVIEEEGIILTTWRELMERRQKVQD